jgi:hypothetical protein
MSMATGVSYSSYGVTIPPFNTGNPDEDNRYFQPDLNLMGKLNVRFIVSEFEISNQGLKQLDVIGKTRIYENLKYEPKASVFNDGNNSEATIEDTKPGRIDLAVNGPGRLEISEQYYPGWNVFVDGVKKDIIIHDQIFQAVDLEPGSHQIIFEYSPILMLYGFAGLFLIIIVYLGVNLAHT